MFKKCQYPPYFNVMDWCRGFEEFLDTMKIPRVKIKKKKCHNCFPSFLSLMLSSLSLSLSCSFRLSGVRVCGATYPKKNIIIIF